MSDSEWGVSLTYEIQDEAGGIAQALGVAELDKDRVVGIEEKPEVPRSSFAVTGMYMYDGEVFDVISMLEPSGRGELEITDVNNYYINQGRGWGIECWMGTGAMRGRLKVY